MKLTNNQRHGLDTSQFALPGRRFPIEDKSHARNALARAGNANPAEQATIRRKVHAKYPSIGVKKYADGGSVDSQTMNDTKIAEEQGAPVINPPRAPAKPAAPVSQGVRPSATPATGVVRTPAQKAADAARLKSLTGMAKGGAVPPANPGVAMSAYARGGFVHGAPVRKR
jgi:hypothetical protein